MEALSIIEKTIEYRKLFDKKSDTYKHATIAICFLVKSYLNYKLWDYYQDFFNESTN